MSRRKNKKDQKLILKRYELKVEKVKLFKEVIFLVKILIELLF